MTAQLSPSSKATLITFRALNVTLDLGTSQTRVCVSERGARHPTLVRNDLSNESSATVVAFPFDSQTLVGDVGSSYVQLRPLQAISHLPPLLSVDLSDEAAIAEAVATHFIPNKLSSEGIDIPGFEPYGTPFSPVLALTLVIKRSIDHVRTHIHQRAKSESAADAAALSAALVDVLPASLTIVLPHASSDRAFASVAEAGKLAGFPAASVYAVRDTYALAGAFTVQRASEVAIKAGPNATQRVAICNVGASHSSVVVVDVVGHAEGKNAPTQPTVTVLSAKGSVGGSSQIDHAVYEMVMEKVVKRDEVTTRGKARVLDQCKKAKVILSSSPAAPVAAEAVSADGMLDVRQTVSADVFAGLAQPTIDATVELLKSALAEADVVSAVPSANVRLELVGGGWRTPAMRSALAAVCGDATFTTLDAATAVIYGGAYVTSYSLVGAENAATRVRLAAEKQAIAAIAAQGVAKETAAAEAAVAALTASMGAAKAADGDAAADDDDKKDDGADPKAQAEAKKLVEAAAASLAAAQTRQKTVDEEAAALKAAAEGPPPAEEAFWSELASAGVVTVDEGADAAKGPATAAVRAKETLSAMEDRDVLYLELAKARNAMDDALCTLGLNLGDSSYRKHIPADQITAAEKVINDTRDKLDEDPPAADDDDAKAARLLPTGRQPAWYAEQLVELKKAVGAAAPALEAAEAKLKAEREAQDAIRKEESDKAAQEVRDPKSDPERIKTAKLRREQGNDLFRKGDHMEEAATRYAQALRILADMYNADGDLKEERVTVSLSCHLNLASICVTLKDFVKAAKHAKEALDIKPDHPKAHFRLGQALLGQQEFDDSRTSLTKANELVPNDAGILRAIAELDAAEAAYKKRRKAAAGRMFGALG